MATPIHKYFKKTSWEIFISDLMCFYRKNIEELINCQLAVKTTLVNNVQLVVWKY